MVPKSKTGQSSSKSQGGSSTSSLDLYNKMHEFVLSRTPDQSNLDTYLNHTLRSSVAQISLEIGWNTAHLSALDVLADLTKRYLLQLAKQTKKYTEHYGRTCVSEDDIVLGLKDMNIQVSELEEYVQNFDPVELTKEMPYFPVPRPTDLKFLRPGSDEVITRPVHVHEYMPSMVFEDKEDKEETKDAKEYEDEEHVTSSSDIKLNVEQQSQEIPGGGDNTAIDQSHAIIANGLTMPLVLEEPSQVPDVGSELIVSEVVVSEEVEIKADVEEEIVEEGLQIPSADNEQIEAVTDDIKEDEMEESSDDDIEPGMKAAVMFATFKSTKKLGTRVENSAIKRFRKVIEEQGLPVRDVSSSVIMLSSGHLSECREGRLPDNKPPPWKDFFDTEPSPLEKKKKPPTMKKILEGVKRLEKSGGHPDSGDENVEEPGLFGVLDKIVSKGGASESGETRGENGAIVSESKKDKDSKKKLSKQERKLLHQTKKKEKELKKLKLKSKSKDKALLKQAKSVQAAAAAKELENSSLGNKLKIFKKQKANMLETGASSISKKKKKDKKNKIRSRELRISLNRVDEDPNAVLSAPIDTEMIESDEDFSNMTEEKSVSPLHIRNPAAAYSNNPDQLSLVAKKKYRKEGKIPKTSFMDMIAQHQHSSKKIKSGLNANLNAIPKIPKNFMKLPFPKKRPALGDDGGPQPKKKRGRPKKVWGDDLSLPGLASGIAPGGGGPMSLPAAQLADIGKSLMKEPQLNMKRYRKEHGEIQDVVMPPLRPPMLTAKTSILSPSKMAPFVNPDFLKRLPAQPGLIPDHAGPLVPPVKLPKELSTSISVTPSLSSPQKDLASVAPQAPRSLASNMCSSVTITRIEMSPQKLPSRFDEAITPGIGPPPGMDGPNMPSIKRGKLGPKPGPPPLLQIPVPTETESGITITPIVMGGNVNAHSSSSGNKDLRYDHHQPLPPPPPLQERPPQKHSMLAKLDEELSSSSPSSKEQRKKDKEKRKELRKEKKKKAKDKSKDKSEKKKKKKDKSGESAASDTAGDLPMQATVPKLTLKLGGHSNTPTPVDSPNPPQIYHDPVPGPTKISFKGFHQEDIGKPPKQPKIVPAHSFIPDEVEEDDDMGVARFAPLVTRPQKTPRAAKTQAAAAVAALGMGTSLSHQEVHFPSQRDSKGGVSGGGNNSKGARGRGRPPKDGVIIGSGSVAAPVATPPPGLKQGKSSLTVLETQTVGCILDDQGNQIWICPACGRQDDGTPMIGCDGCDDWYHFVCVGILEAPKEEDSWYCVRCMKKQREGKQKKRK